MRAQDRNKPRAGGGYTERRQATVVATETHWRQTTGCLQADIELTAACTMLRDVMLAKKT